MTEAQTEPSIHLSPTDEAILDEIDAHGRATPALLADITDSNTQHIRDRLNRLVEHDLLTRVSRGLYDRPQSAREYLSPEELDAE